MGNKAKKRAIGELNPAEKSGNANAPGQERKKIFKKAKVNINSPQTGNKAKEAALTKPQVNNGNPADESKKLKKQKVHLKSGFQVSEAESEKKDVKPGQEKVLDTSVVMSKKLKKLKANQLKREKRKQGRKEHGQYHVQETMSAESMRQKIDEIQTRGNLTKTAKRKLRILKKKLSIAEGTAPPPPSPPKINPEGGVKLTKNQKKKLRKAKMQLEKAQNQDSADVPTDEPIKKEAVLGKKIKQEVETEVGNKKKLELNNVKATLKKPNKNLQKADPKVKVPVESDEEEDESEDEDESLEEAEIPTSPLVKKEEPVPMEFEDSEVEDKEDDEDEEDEEEGDDEEEEVDGEEEEVDDEEGEESDDNEEDEKNLSAKKLSDVKGKKEPKNKNTSKIPTQENGEKKKRYVLFVGNVPFKATTEEIKQHFLQKVSDVVSVRIPTHPGTKKPRGFAYVEVSNNVDYEKGLSLHQTSLQGFKLNVEYTQTGSKNIKNKQELVAKNKKLHAIRKAGKLAGSKKENHKRSFRRNFKNKIQQPRKV